MPLQAGDVFTTPALSRNMYLELIRQERYSEAYNFLLEDPLAIDNLTVKQLAEHYQKYFKKVIPIGPIGILNGLARILKERVLGEDSEFVV